MQNVQATASHLMSQQSKQIALSVHCPQCDSPDRGDELLLADADPVPVGAVHHVNDCIRVGVVTPPVRPDTGLTPKVPDLEWVILNIFDHYQ